ncbi:ABC transporter permease [Candidatus Enterococcus clewellii]|uniref:ABC3 transporter permease C-terminal domain-containing protein n=1 Tax=Candidatus Enterococcus clewellii TaxID=1834193 RepID=A0A242KCD1_9ENTE|nr:ABC transporter permease [Enterococcus sp. 9E7_DIV0242]OTP18821.1 hypothetical protein A5888_000635 [Enterococcus sp. 9E7_DIV0242]
MKKKQLWKDIRRSIAGSYGRFLSIFSLMLLGAFAFVGLKVTGPDMRTTAENFYAENQLAFLTVTSTWGLDEEDQETLKKAEQLDEIEFGYLKDVVVKNTDTSFRIFSAPKNLSKYEVVEGELPSRDDEIAVDYQQQKDYKLGDEIHFSEEKNADDETILKQETFKITGFVKSSELIDKTSIGQTTVGRGQLDSYGVVLPEVFDSELFMIARLSFTDMQKIDAYSDDYNEISGRHKEDIEQLTANRPSQRLTDLKTEKQKLIDNSYQEITDVKNELLEAETKLVEAREQIDAAKEQLTESESSLSLGIPELQQQYANFSQEIASQEATYNEQLAAFNKKKSEAETEIADGEKELSDRQADLEDLAAPVYTVNDRKENPGYKQYLENSQRIDILSNVFPVFLFAIAALVSLTTMTRFVDEQRINMGTLKALGYSNRDIKKKFVVYGLIPSSLGAIAGTLLGHTLLPIVIFNAYAATSTFSEIMLLFSLKYTVLAVLTAVICTVVPAYLLATGELKERTASLLLPKPPKAGARILLERIKPIWNRMSFTYKVTARNLFRYKKRMFMTIIGVAGCTALLITGFGIRDSLSGIVDKQFGEVINYDLITIYDEEEDIDQKLSEKKIAEKMESADVRYEEVSVVAGENDDKQSITLLASDNPDNFSKFVKLRERTTEKTISLSNKGVILSEKLAKLLDVERGDSVIVQDDEQINREFLVSDISEMYMGHYIFMGSTAYAEAFERELNTNGKLMTLDDRSASNSDQMATELMDIDGVKGVVQSKELSGKIAAVMDGLNSVIVVLIVCAILLAVVVIYNLTNINVSERIRELSTIKVLGFYDKEVTLYIYRETIILSIFGTLVGYVLGFFLHSFIMVSLPPDEAMFNPELMGMNFILSAVITLAITFIIMGVMHRKIKSVNMLDALKSID